jgi:2-polyprenyl-3-methyl-5-hydroxy-6-metoxy-1,4-benzoquinol methylase
VSASNEARPSPPDNSAFISDEVREQCEMLHSRKKLKWGNDGHKRAREVLDFIQELRARSVLDYGCGRGTLAKGLGAGGKKISGLGWMGPVYEYDPAIPKKARNARRVDLVVCTDVLEHVEPDKLAAVLAHVRSLARMGAYLLACTREANTLLPDGRNAHLIVQPANWWLRRIEEAGFTILRHEVRGSEVVVEAE